jgi:hypothetical protein
VGAGGSLLRIDGEGRVVRDPAHAEGRLERFLAADDRVVIGTDRGLYVGTTAADAKALAPSWSEGEPTLVIDHAKNELWARNERLLRRWDGTAWKDVRFVEAHGGR